MKSRSPSSLLPQKINLSLGQLKPKETLFDKDLNSNPTSPKLPQKKTINFKKVFKKSPKSYFMQHTHFKDSFHRFNKIERKPLGFSHSKQDKDKPVGRSSSVGHLKSRFTRNSSQANITFSASNQNNPFKLAKVVFIV